MSLSNRQFDWFKTHNQIFHSSLEYFVNSLNHMTESIEGLSKTKRNKTKPWEKLNQNKQKHYENKNKTKNKTHPYKKQQDLNKTNQKTKKKKNTKKKKKEITDTNKIFQWINSDMYSKNIFFFFQVRNPNWKITIPGQSFSLPGNKMRKRFIFVAFFSIGIDIKKKEEIKNTINI